MSTSTIEDNPQLDAPGAGVPAPLLFVAKRLFAMKCRFGNTADFIEAFEKERLQIRQLAEACPPEKRSQRVLIDPIRGLEDSSRYWSVWMTLEHIQIVTDAISQIIAELSQGRQPDFEVRTQDVKPSPEAGADTEQAFEACCDRFLKAVNEAGELKTKLKHDHPWFGPLDAYRWLALSAMHLGIHREQISAILAKLPR